MTARSTARLLLTAMTFAAGCTTSGALTPSASTTTAMTGWERYLRVDFTAASRPGGSDLEGYVYSSHGTTIVNVQLLAQGLDASGNLVGQKMEWVPLTVPGLQRAYFRISGMPPAAQYRVTVWAYDRLEGHGWL
jgi:hypothetical protein